MSTLTIYSEDGSKIFKTMKDLDSISNTLFDIGVQFERWVAGENLPSNATQEQVLAAYQSSIDTLNKKYGFQSVDVVSLHPDHPEKAAFRQKFLAEHTHGDFEIRFFVDGSGLFYLHVQDKVYAVLCEKGDLISVPANTTHWFDMGDNPSFKCIRFFTTADGWVGEFTGNEIAKKLPTYDEYRSSVV